MKKISAIIILMFLCLACQPGRIKGLDLTKDIWVLRTQDYLHKNQVKTMVLRFNKNGYAYEENTILKYKWQLYQLADILEINGQEFEILGVRDERIYLRNMGTGIEANLSKLK